MIDCKAYADEILDSVTGFGHLAVVSIGDDPASQVYIKGKRKDCERVGFKFTHCAFKEGDPEEEIASKIATLNRDSDVTGIILQLPVPDGYDANWLAGMIDKSKDVDGLRPDSPFKACTPEGIVYLLKRELGELAGKHAVVIGRGKLVGKPLSKMLLDEDMTVTVCHSKTPLETINELSWQADAIIVAAGCPEYFIFDEIGADTVVIDCGIHRNGNGTLCGDVRSTTSDKFTPVPGGVGLLTRAMLIKHVERDWDEKD